MSQPSHKDFFSISFCGIAESQVALYGFEGKGLSFDPAIPNEISRRLKLLYDAKGDPVTEVCYLNSPELRSEFKVSFTTLDLSDYLNAVLLCAVDPASLKHQITNESFLIPYPSDSEVFWRFVEAGAALRQGAAT